MGPSRREGRDVLVHESADAGTTCLSTWRGDSRQEVDHETSRRELKKSRLRNRPADDSSNNYVHDNVGNAGSTQDRSQGKGGRPVRVRFAPDRLIDTIGKPLVKVSKGGS